MRRGFTPALALACGSWLTACGARPSIATETSTSETSDGSESGDGDAETDDGTDDGTACEPWDEDSQPTGLGDVAVSFVDVTAEAGLSYRYYPDAWPPDCDPMGEGTIDPPCKMQVQAGGAAVADFDEDGWPDVYATRLAERDLLFRNRGDGTFEEVGLTVGLDRVFDGNGAGWIDVDEDGDLDLYVTSLDDSEGASFYLFVNEGGTFVEDAEARGVALRDDLPHWGMSVGMGDYDHDGWLDLYTTEWWPGTTATVDSMHTRLLRNRGEAKPGHFEDVTVEAGVSMLMQNPPGLFAFAPAFVDLDEDGWEDLAITSDLGTSRLFWNNGDGVFLDGTKLAGVSLEQNGMGSTFGDLDGDGHLDWYVTAIHSPTDCGDMPCGGGGNRFYRNLGPRCFEELADAWKIDDGFWGWGTVAFDMDNDGDLDLAETNGFRVPHGKPYAKFADDPCRLWRNDGPGAFVELAEKAGLAEARDGRGLMSFDYDGDGDLDLFAVAGDGPRLYRNDGGDQNGWLRVEARGTISNGRGLGARVELWRTEDGPVQVRQIGADAHLLAQRPPIAHFGLGPGDATVARLVVTFPATGTRRELTHLDPRQTVVVTE